MRLTSVLFIAVAALAVLPSRPPSASGGDGPQRTRLQIELRRHDGRIFIYGGIIARDRECRVGRKVTLRSDGVVIGSNRARNGYWEVKPFADPPGDTPHVLKAEVARRGDRCRGATARVARRY